MPDQDPSSNAPEVPDANEIWADSSARPAALSKRERAAVLARIEALMEFWGITVDDLTAPTPEPEIPSPPLGPLPVKYRHPVSGETWDGQGAHPDWLRHALLKEGLRVDELRPAAGPPAGTDAA
ncbi:H-NS histone family protein [Ideonella sp. YS5]|uniref:H-NS histone family protein n=1 Tax=Ideonella sp. YS5 TaxID=3453714 RepID=UPI003EEEEA67